MGLLQALTLGVSLLSVAAGYLFRVPVVYPILPPVNVFPPMPPVLQAPRRAMLKVHSTNSLITQQGVPGGLLGGLTGLGQPGNPGQTFAGLPEISLPVVMAQGGFTDAATDFPVFDAPNIQWIWPKGEKTGLPSIMNTGDTASASASASPSSSGLVGDTGPAGVVFGGSLITG